MINGRYKSIMLNHAWHIFVVVLSKSRGPSRAFHAYEISRFPRDFQISRFLPDFSVISDFQVISMICSYFRWPALARLEKHLISDFPSTDFYMISKLISKLISARAYEISARVAALGLSIHFSPPPPPPPPPPPLPPPGNSGGSQSTSYRCLEL